MPKDPESRAEALCALMPDLGRAARSLTRDRTAADDLMQDALLRVWARIDAGADIDDLRPYLMTTLRNLARRPARAFDELEEKDVPVTAAVGTRRLVTEDVMHAIDALPPNQAALLARAAEGQSHYADLAREFDLPLGTVMSRLARARARLRADLDLSPGDAVAELLTDAADH